MTSHRSDSPSRAETFSFAKSHWVLLPWLHSAADNNGKKIRGGGFLIHICTQMPHWLLLFTVMTSRSAMFLGQRTSAHDHGSLYLAEFSTDFRAVWVTNVKTLFMIHVLKQL